MISALMPTAIFLLTVNSVFQRRRLERLERDLATMRRVFTIEQSMDRIATVLERPGKKDPDV